MRKAKSSYHKRITRTVLTFIFSAVGTLPFRAHSAEEVVSKPDTAETSEVNGYDAVILKKNLPELEASTEEQSKEKGSEEKGSEAKVPQEHRFKEKASKEETSKEKEKEFSENSKEESPTKLKEELSKTEFSKKETKPEIVGEEVAADPSKTETHLDSSDKADAAVVTTEKMPTEPSQESFNSPAFEQQLNEFLSVEGTEKNTLKDNDVVNLDMDGLIDFARQNNATFAAAQKNVEIAKGDLVTAGLLSNPQLYYSHTFIGGLAKTEAGLPEIAPGISFEVDFVGKRWKRQEVAEKGVAHEKMSFADFERLFKFQLRQTYREYLLLSEQLRYKKSFFDTYLSLIKASKVRLEKGDLSGVEYDRLELEQIGYEADYRVTELQLIEISQRMRKLLGISPLNAILPLKGGFVFVPLSELGVTKKKVAIEKRPDLAALIAKMEQSDAFASLKRREVIPDITLGGEYRMKGPDGYFGFTVSMPLPVFNRNQGEILKAQQTSKKLHLEAQAKKQEISGELQIRLRELMTREKMLLKYEELKLLDKNRSVAERSRFAYLRKAYSIVELLESQRNYMNVQKSYYEQLYNYYSSIDGFFAATEGT